MKRTAVFCTAICVVMCSVALDKEKEYDFRMSVRDSFAVSETSNWNVKVLKECALRFADVEITPRKGNDFNLVLYFKCDTEDLHQFDTPEKMKSAVFDSTKEYLPYIVEKTIKVVPLSITGLYGFVTVITDKDLARHETVEPGQFRYITRGMIRLTRDSALGFSLMTNELRSPLYRHLMQYVLTFAHQESGTSPHTTTTRAKPSLNPY